MFLKEIVDPRDQRNMTSPHTPKNLLHDEFGYSQSPNARIEILKLRERLEECRAKLKECGEETKKGKTKKKRKTKKNPCFPPKGKTADGLKYLNSKACIKAQIRDNPWMLEKGGTTMIGNGPLLDEVKRQKKDKTKKNKQHSKGYTFKK